MDMILLVNGATTTVWVTFVMTKHPQSHAHAQLNLNPLYMISHQQIGLLTWTRPQESFRIDVDTWRLLEFCGRTTIFFIYMLKFSIFWWFDYQNEYQRRFFKHKNRKNCWFSTKIFEVATFKATEVKWLLFLFSINEKIPFRRRLRPKGCWQYLQSTFNKRVYRQSR